MGCILIEYVLNLVLVLSFLMLSSFHQKKKKKCVFATTDLSFWPCLSGFAFTNLISSRKLINY